MHYNDARGVSELLRTASLGLNEEDKERCEFHANAGSLTPFCVQTVAVAKQAEQ